MPHVGALNSQDNSGWLFRNWCIRAPIDAHVLYSRALLDTPPCRRGYLPTRLGKVFFSPGVTDMKRLTLALLLCTAGCSDVIGGMLSGAGDPAGRNIGAGMVGNRGTSTGQAVGASYGGGAGGMGAATMNTALLNMYMG